MEKNENKKKKLKIHMLFLFYDIKSQKRKNV